MLPVGSETHTNIIKTFQGKTTLSTCLLNITEVGSPVDHTNTFCKLIERNSQDKYNIYSPRK